MRTNNLLATGGMKQQGGTVDPVSGNAVPVGSLQNEVRDDVPAQLSPGEFVFPADVTRYIGLDKLMQIREAAKEGLQKMDSMGQMGNSEEVAGGSGNEDQFSSHIDDIISTVDGKENVKKFAGGGGVNTSDYSGAPLSGFKMELYEDPKTKITRYIPSLDGKPLLPIPSGYIKKVGVAPVETTTTTPTSANIVDDMSKRGGGGGSNKVGDGTDTTGGAGGKETPEGFGGLQGGTGGTFAKLVGLLPGPLGLLGSAAAKFFTQEQNKRIAAANAKAIDASALSSMGFSAESIKAAQEATAKATLEGKSAKEIAVAAANAASLGVATGAPKDSLDALIGITNGFNTMTNEQAKINLQETNVNASLAAAGLEGQVPAGMWAMVVRDIQMGYPAEAAVQRAIEASDAAAAKEAKDAQDAKETQDAKDAAAANMAALAKEAKDAQDAQDAKDAAAANMAAVAKEAKDAQDAKDAKDAAAAKEAQDAKDAQDAKEAKDATDAAAASIAMAKETQDAKEAQDSKDAAAANMAAFAKEAVQDTADATIRADAQTVSRWSSDVNGGGRGSDTSGGRYSGDNSGDNKGWGSRDAG